MIKGISFYRSKFEEVVTNMDNFLGNYFSLDKYPISRGPVPACKKRKNDCWDFTMRRPGEPPRVKGL